MILIFDGPEKAGKTTLIGAVRSALISRGVNVVIRKWGPVFPDDRVYAPALRGDVDNSETVTIWDRSWAAEAVCGYLLNRDRRLSNDWFLGEWLHTRPVRAVGSTFMVLGDEDQLAARRDETDIPVDPGVELENYEFYAQKFRWQILHNEYTAESLKSNVQKVLFRMDIINEFSRELLPPFYVGPQDAKVVIVGKSPSDHQSITRAWGPFSSRLTTMLGRDLGARSLGFGWTNRSSLSDEAVRDRSVVVACGSGNHIHVPISTPVFLRIDHPSYVYRFGRPCRIKIERGSMEDVLSVFPSARVADDGTIFYQPKV